MSDTGVTFFEFCSCSGDMKGFVLENALHHGVGIRIHQAQPLVDMELLYSLGLGNVDKGQELQLSQPLEERLALDNIVHR